MEDAEIFLKKGLVAAGIPKTLYKILDLKTIYYEILHFFLIKFL